VREAFDSGSIEELRTYVNTLPMEEARLYMKKMVGQCRPNPASITAAPFLY